MNDHLHDRFLQEKNGFLIFGCVNPFCGHGSPALPNRWKIPLETNALKMKLLSHKNRRIKLEITVKNTNTTTTMECDDNGQACAEEFKRLME